MSDLRQRVPGHSLVDELLRQWDVGTIHIDPATDGVVIDDEAVGWYRGVIGERRVAGLLARLGSAWTVLHSVPVGSGMSDIDHVVIGEAGVFTINTKYSPGKKVWSGGFKVYVDGFPQQYVRNSVFEAERASEALSRAVGMTVPVSALIVFVEPGSLTRKAPTVERIDAPAVQVLTDVELLAAFSTRPVFSSEQTTRIVEMAVRPETWHSAPVASSTGRHISQEFEALETAVGPRLASPVVRPPVPKRTYAASPKTRQPAAARPARARASSKRRPKQSKLEKLLAAIALPIVGFVTAWIYLLQLGQH